MGENVGSHDRAAAETDLRCQHLGSGVETGSNHRRAAGPEQVLFNIADGDGGYLHPANEFVADFIGEAGFLPAKVKSVQGDACTVTVNGADFEVPTAREGLQPGEDCKLLLRPEAGNAQIAYDPSKIQAAWVEVKTAGESVALPKNEDENGNTIFKCTDKSNPDISYPFIGWIVEKANSQQAYANDAQTRNAESTTQVYWINQTASFPMPAYSITLRPLFSYKQYAVTFDGNGADPVTVPPTQYFYYGEFAKNLWNPLTQGAPVKEGYTFNGWSESIDGEETGNVYNYDDQFVMPENDVTLTAQFASDSEGYTLTYQSGDAQYGYPPMAETVPAGQTVTIRGNDGGLGKDGHEFTLWSDGSVEYIPGTTIVMPEEDLFLYPVFVKVPDPLPEDEIGTYSFDEAGNKFYIQFHSYDICMNYMGDDNLCRNTSTNLYNR